MAGERLAARGEGACAEGSHGHRPGLPRQPRSKSPCGDFARDSLRLSPAFGSAFYPLLAIVVAGSAPYSPDPFVASHGALRGLSSAAHPPSDTSSSGPLLDNRCI